MQGQALRDSADRFADVDCIVLGASFDTPADNLAFATQQGFGYRLLADTDRSVGQAYQVVRDPDDQYASFPRRISYLIDPSGTIRRSYVVTDVAGHAQHVLTDLDELQQT